MVFVKRRGSETRIGGGGNGETRAGYDGGVGAGFQVGPVTERLKARVVSQHNDKGHREEAVRRMRRARCSPE